MGPVSRALAVGLLIVAGTALVAQAPTKEEIAKAVKQLGDDDFNIRQKASAFLKAAGQAAEAALREAARSPDAEVARRAMEILEDFKWGAYPETPKDILAQIQRYRGGDETDRRLACRQLAKLGPKGHTALLKIASAEDDPQRKRAIFREMGLLATQSAGEFLLAGNHADLDSLLELASASGNEADLRQYAAQLHFRGRLADKIEDLKAQLVGKPPPAKGGHTRAVAELLTYLCRAKGDLEAARWAADKSENKRLSKAILTEAAAWKELAQRLDKGDDPDEFGIEKLTFSLAFHRLAGDNDGFDRDLKELRKFCDDRPDDAEYTWLAAKALFLNDRAALAMQLLTKAKVYQPAFDILCFQSKYQEAFELADQARDAKPDQALAIQLSKARVLANLGKKDQALPIFAKLVDQLAERDSYPTARDLIRVLVRVGYREQALDSCLWLLKKVKEDEELAQTFDLVFNEHGTLALAWWKVIRTKHPGDDPGPALRQLRLLFEGKLPQRDLEELVQLADKGAANFKSLSAATFAEAVAHVLSAAGQKDQEQQYLERLDANTTNATLLQRLGDLLLEKKRFEPAGQRYRQAWERDRSQPLPLFLQGVALAQAGQEGLGKKLKELAHWLPLGNEQVRHQFARGLYERGFLDDARQEYDLILRQGKLEGYVINETLRYAGYTQQTRKEYARAAEWFEQFRLRCMQIQISFIDYGAHVQVPALVHQNRARALAAAGKFDDARKEMDHCFTLMPAGNVNLVINLVLTLDKANRKQQADELYQQAHAIHEKLSRAYPESASEHNTLAWLGACCRRQLEEALVHANQAVKLAPDNAGCLDTLAEVLFQRGQEARALELMKRCIELEPRNDYFKKQLKRFEAGDRNALVPDEEE